jgi:hypothetical protein
MERKTMKSLLITVFILCAVAFGQGERELPPIQVHEWGVLAWSGGDPVLSSAPATIFPADSAPVEQQYLLRAPVLYFHGPDFSGSVTVKTKNGSIFDIYPPVPDADRGHNYCRWNADFTNTRLEEYPDLRGLAPGNWNYDLWRVDYAMVVSLSNGWSDKFLYYETAPENTDFLPFSPGMESVCEEYKDIEAVAVKTSSSGLLYARCTLGNIVNGGEMDFSSVESAGIVGILYEWAGGVIDFEEVDALWQTWAPWVLADFMNEPEYSNGLVLYMIPQELTENLSTISVVSDEMQYPVQISRFLLVAMPL